MQARRAWTLIASCALALTTLGGVGAPPVAASDPEAKLVTSAVLGTKVEADGATIRVARNGNYLLTSTSKGLTKFKVTHNGVTRLGTATTRYQYPFVLHPRLPLAYVPQSRAGTRDGMVLRVYDVSGRVPRPVHSLTVRRVLPYDDQLAVTPDGRRLLLNSADGILSFGLARPARPRSPRLVRVEAHDFALTPDGHRLVTTHADWSPTGGNGPAHVVVRRLGKHRFPALRSVELTSYDQPDADWSVSDLAVSPDGESLHLETGHWSTTEVGGDETIDLMLSKLRLSDLTLVAKHAPAPDWQDSVELGDFSPSGERLYAIKRIPHDETQDFDGDLVWFGSDLAVRHDAGVGGRVEDIAVSPAGRTRGLVYALTYLRGKARVAAIRVR